MSFSLAFTVSDNRLALTMNVTLAHEEADHMSERFTAWNDQLAASSSLLGLVVSHDGRIIPRDVCL